MNVAMASTGAATAQPQVSPADMLIVEMQGMADCLAKMTESGYSKCIPKVHESKLSVGEMSCVDRCVSKYMDVHAAVGSELQGTMANAAQAGGAAPAAE